MMGLMASFRVHVIHDASERIYLMSSLTSGAGELVKIELSEAAPFCRYYASPAGYDYVLDKTKFGSVFSSLNDFGILTDISIPHLDVNLALSHKVKKAPSFPKLSV
ncbi:hypothetical protein TNIN_231541 [Trichonephila inaurata madagascariensis]|uniref:Uncharacterized protein n=1 Tax=Trichonephila inaurata madagascariensis TaxID=2747483 RepID=A0A8X6XW03_9ARAC|nr:hypothetical protein TNIN_231541 [Trichonephila inaurata madagascariensis]